MGGGYANASLLVSGQELADHLGDGDLRIMEEVPRFIPRFRKREQRPA